MKIFDCFMYFDEDLILDLRLNLLDARVDYFVIVESKFNHKGEKRELKFDINKYQRFEKKIIYLIFDQIPNNLDIIKEDEDKDIRIDVFRSSGPGGQSVNTTDSAVRITHLPSGIVVSQQDEKSQHKNKAKALKILRSRILDNEIQEKNQQRSIERKSQVGSGDRSERIRTYNFPQGRVSDHRINLTLYNLTEVLEGNLDDLINPLIADEETKKLAELGNE